jgi:hypothetical protein
VLRAMSLGCAVRERGEKEWRVWLLFCGGVMVESWRVAIGGWAVLYCIEMESGCEVKRSSGCPWSTTGR